MEKRFTSENFETEVLKSDVPVLVDFYADWCGPCKMMAPTVEELAADFAGKAKVGKAECGPESGDCRALRHHVHPHASHHQRRRCVLQGHRRTEQTGNRRRLKQGSHVTKTAGRRRLPPLNGAGRGRVNFPPRPVSKLPLKFFKNFFKKVLTFGKPCDILMDVSRMRHKKQNKASAFSSVGRAVDS